MDIDSDEEAPPELFDASKDVDSQDILANELNKLSIVKVPITIVTGKFTTRQRAPPLIIDALF